MIHKRLIQVWLLLVLLLTAEGASAEATKFPWLTVAPELGWQFFSKSILEHDFNSTFGPRNGVVVKAHADLGGDKWALELAPLYARQASKGAAGNTSAFGGEMTLAYRFTGRSLYPGMGLGFHGAYLFPTDTMERGVELAARIPLGMTWYFFKYLGLVVEGGFMVGAVGVRYKPVADPVLRALSENTEFGLTLGCDLLIGLRFP